jgi:transposase
VRRAASEALREARRALQGLGARGQTARVPQRVRRAVLAYVDAARDEGQAWGQIAEALGLSESALRRWRADDEGRDGVALLPVEMIADEAPVVAAWPTRGIGGALTLVSPRGYRVEGLGVEQLAALLARIGS